MARNNIGPPALLISLDYFDAFQGMTHEQIGRLVLALMQYAVAGSHSVDLKEEKILFPMLKRDRDADFQKWEEKAARNRENGSKGGRPRKNCGTENDEEGDEETHENPVGFSETQKTPITDTDTDTDAISIDYSVTSDRSAAGGNYLTNYDDLTATTEYARRCIYKLSEADVQQIVTLMTRAPRMCGELIRYAIDEACGAEKVNGWGYVKTILNRFQDQGIKTLQDAIADSKAFHEAKERAVRPNYHKGEPVKLASWDEEL